MQAAARLVNQGVEVLLTAVYRPAQMLAACAIGARYVAPYVGRMTDTGTADAVGATVAMQQIADRAGASTLVLAASLRTVDDVTALAVGGVRAFTLSPAVAWQVLTDERSQAATDVFEDTMGRLGQEVRGGRTADAATTRAIPTAVRQSPAAVSGAAIRPPAARRTIPGMMPLLFESGRIANIPKKDAPQLAARGRRRTCPEDGYPSGTVTGR